MIGVEVWLEPVLVRTVLLKLIGTMCEPLNKETRVRRSVGRYWGEGKAVPWLLQGSGIVGQACAELWIQESNLRSALRG